MKTIKIFKAQRIVRSEPIESLTIVFDEELPEDKRSLGEYEKLYDFEADHLVDALTSVLSQGVLDRVIGKLMLKRASLFVIPMVTTNGKEHI